MMTACADPGLGPDSTGSDDVTVRGTVELSVIVPARDVSETIAEQLDALLAQTWDASWEIVVADNGSTDATRAIVERYAAGDDRVRLVDASEHVGVAHCRNAGIHAARGRAVALCDADDRVAPGWVQAMGEALRDHELVTGRLDVHELNPAWLAESRGRAIEGAPSEFAGLFRIANGGNLGVRRAVLERYGDFDQRYLPGEDVEFSLRLWRAGIAVVYVPDALIYYRYRQSMGALWRQARAFGRIQPALHALARSQGLAPSDRGEWRRWLWLVRHFGSLRTSRGRAYWLFIAGGRVGRLQGRWRAVARRGAW